MAEHAGPVRKREARARTRATRAGTSSDSRSDLLSRRNAEAVTGPTRLLQRRAASAAAAAPAAPVREAGPQPIQSPRKNPTGLPDRLKAGLEALSGLSMDDVRVHRNSSAPSKLGALAFAQGTNIHLAPGQDHHLPHEAWHVVQQKQGRVRATRQLKLGLGLNDDRALEREADRMGEHAAAAAARPGAALRPAAAAAGTVLQAVRVFRGGQWLDEEPYVPQPGDVFPEAVMHQPAVLLDQGTRELRIGNPGSTTDVKRKEPPPHTSLQALREAQGEEIRSRLKADPKSIGTQVKALDALAEKIEKAVGDAVPKNHKEKIAKMTASANVTGANYRAVIKGQDEINQSQGTAALHRGLSRERGNTPPPVRKELREYRRASFRVHSAHRIPTESVVAPVHDKGVVKGHQHPTSQSQPKLTEGSSSHSYSDRERVHQASQLVEHIKKNKNTPANTLLLTGALKAGQFTFSSMSAPTTEKGRPQFNLKRSRTQVEERERGKTATNILAEELGFPVSKQTQDLDALSRPYDTPTSPRREDPPSKKPKLAPVAATATATTTTTMTTTPPTTTTTAPKKPVKEVEDLAQAVAQTGQALLGAIPQDNDALRAPGRQALAARVQTVIDAVPLVDVTDANNVATLGNLYHRLNQLFLSFRNVIRRPLTGNSGGGATTAQGQRIAALRQFFSECGQMAARNALVLAQYPNLNDQALPPALADEAALGTLGNFHNNIAEDGLRQILAQAGRNDLPVVSNIAQANTIMNYVAANNQHALQALHIGLIEQAGAARLRQFVTGAVNSIVIVLNTEGAKLKGGYHWISVRIDRTQQGLAVRYLDSLDAPADYSALFTALRHFLSGQPQQPGQQGPQGGGGSAKTTGPTKGKGTG